MTTYLTYTADYRVYCNTGVISIYCIIDNNEARWYLPVYDLLYLLGFDETPKIRELGNQYHITDAKFAAYLDSQLTSTICVAFDKVIHLLTSSILLIPAKLVLKYHAKLTDAIKTCIHDQSKLVSKFVEPTVDPCADAKKHGAQDINHVMARIDKRIDSLLDTIGSLSDKIDQGFAQIQHAINESSNRAPKKRKTKK